MTVGELIHALDVYDEDLEVCIQAGIDDPIRKIIEITTEIPYDEENEVVMIDGIER